MRSIRTLYTPACPNLLAAGRSLSAEPMALASARVQGTAMALGEAAGIAAALCGRDKRPVSDVDISVLRARLTAGGARLDA